MRELLIPGVRPKKTRGAAKAAHRRDRGQPGWPAEKHCRNRTSGGRIRKNPAPSPKGMRRGRRLDHRSYVLPILKDVAYRAVITIGGSLHRILVRRCQYVFFLDDRAPRSSQLIDPIQLHDTPLPANRDESTDANARQSQSALGLKLLPSRTGARASTGQERCASHRLD